MAQWFKNKKFARNISALLPKVLYLWIIIMRYWEQKIIIKLLHHNLKNKMSYVLKQTKSINSHNTHILKKKGKCRKKSHNFLVQNFQKKNILSYYLLLPILQFFKSPPHTWLPPPFWATPKKLPKQTQRSICKCQKW